MPTPTVGQACVYVDGRGIPRRAVIVAVHEATMVKRVQVTQATVDLLYAEGDGPVELATARRKFSALHESQQGPNGNGDLVHYWTEGA